MNAQQIYRAFAGKLHGSRQMKRLVCLTLARLPPEITRHITDHCWFLGSTDDAWAYTLRGDELVGKHLIILSDELISQDEEQVSWTIAHEIGHVVLGHRNSILVAQSKAEIRTQEDEADEFASRYFPRP